MNITDFLLARIEEDEAAARSATPGPWKIDEYDAKPLESIVSTAVDRPFGWVEVARSMPPDAEFITRHAPSRALAECAAKRAIIDMPASYSSAVRDGVGIAWVGARSAEEVTGEVLKSLATIYKDHPDYQPEWE